MSEITRTEKFLRACIDGEPCALKPLTRVEKLLAELNDKLAGGPSEVVILPETEIAYNEQLGVLAITTAINAYPEEGKTYAVMYAGTAYDCPCVKASLDGETQSFCMGDTTGIGAPGGNADAPFLIMIFPTPMELEGGGMAYGGVMTKDGATTVTLSIVEKAETASAGGGGVFYVDCTPGELIEGTDQATLVGMTKTYEETFAAYEAGQIVAFRVDMGGMADGLITISFISGYMPGFGLVFGNEGGFAYKSDGTAIMMNA